MRVPAIANTDEEDVEIIQQFMNGNCVLVYGSSEYLLSTESVFLTVKASRRCRSGSLFRNTVSADVLFF